jgi:hypothetical protein
LSETESEGEEEKEMTVSELSLEDRTGDQEY